MAGKDMQANFLEALNSLKEYAKVNGQIISKDDVLSYFKDMDIDEAKLNMIYGYLLANGIKVSGEDAFDNSFMAMMESEEEENDEQFVDMLTEEDYAKDEENLKLYLKELESAEVLSDTTRAYLLMNIVEDNDKDSLRLLSESMLTKIVEWIKPYKRQGVLSEDLIQEANLTMMAYVSEKRFTNNYEWKEAIKEGTTQDLIRVLNEIEEEIKSEVAGCIQMLIDEQQSSNMVSKKVLNKVNLVNDWAVRIKEELGRKPTVDEVAERMDVSKETVLEAIELSAGKIEDITR